MAGIPVTSAATVAIALGPGRGVAAWWPRGGGPAQATAGTFAFDAAALAAGDAADLRAAMLALWRAVGRTDCDVHVVLAAPWSASCIVPLPPMREAEARAVIARAADRYFAVPRAEPVVDVSAIARPRGAPARWLVSDADGVVLQTIARAVHDAGGASVRIVSAVDAWARASGTAAGRVYVVDEVATVIDAQGGRVSGVRRCRAADIDTADPRAATGRGASHSVAADALETAARHAPWCDSGELVHPATRLARRAAASRLTRRLVLAGVGALALAVGVRARGVQRHETLIARDRAALRPALLGVLARHDSLTALGDALGALARADAAAPRWSARLWALSAALPDDAWFTAVRGVGDSVLVEGRATSAASVFDAMRGAREVESVRATAPIVIGEGPGGSREAFSVVVRFRPAPEAAP